VTEPVPDSWPPSPTRFAPNTPVPLFPLPAVWLFPRSLIPLHVFEPRYRQMIEDSLDRSGRIVLGTVEEGHEDELAGAPPIHPIAGLGEIFKLNRLEDGRFHLLLLGLCRVRVKEVDSDRMYRQVEVEELPEIEVPEEKAAQIRGELTEAIVERSDELLNLPEDLPLGILSDLLVLRLDLPHERRQELYSELDPLRRARAAIVEHHSNPPSPEDETEEGSGGGGDAGELEGDEPAP
jgi:Lon protease-like protein